MAPASSPRTAVVKRTQSYLVASALQLAASGLFSIKLSEANLLPLAHLPAVKLFGYIAVAIIRHLADASIGINVV